MVARFWYYMIYNYQIFLSNYKPVHKKMCKHGDYFVHNLQDIFIILKRMRFMKCLIVHNERTIQIFSAIIANFY